jgi:hypothetical protein
VARCKGDIAALDEAGEVTMLVVEADDAAVGAGVEQGFVQDGGQDVFEQDGGVELAADAGQSRDLLGNGTARRGRRIAAQVSWMIGSAATASRWEEMVRRPVLELLLMTAGAVCSSAVHWLGATSSMEMSPISRGRLGEFEHLLGGQVHVEQVAIRVSRQTPSARLSSTAVFSSATCALSMTISPGA